MYIFENKETGERKTYTTMRAISRAENINWETLRYHFKKKKKTIYENTEFRIDKA